MLHVARTLMVVLIFGVIINSGQADGSIESKNVLALFKGEDRDTAAECYLHILSETRQAGTCDGYSVAVVSGYTHEDSAPGRVTLTHPNNNTEMLTGEGPNSMELRAARTGRTECGYAGITVFSLHWLHADHYHTVTCRNLIQVY